MFSTRSFSDARRSSARRSSSLESAERPIVPLMRRRVSTRRLSSLRTRSGELDAMVSLPYRRRAAKGAGFNDRAGSRRLADQMSSRAIKRCAINVASQYRVDDTPCRRDVALAARKVKCSVRAARIHVVDRERVLIG